jgi:hypothetical protein
VSAELDALLQQVREGVEGLKARLERGEILLANALDSREQAVQELAAARAHPPIYAPTINADTDTDDLMLAGLTVDEVIAMLKEKLAWSEAERRAAMPRDEALRLGTRLQELEVALAHSQAECRRLAMACPRCGAADSRRSCSACGWTSP